MEYKHVQMSQGVPLPRYQLQRQYRPSTYEQIGPRGIAAFSELQNPNPPRQFNRGGYLNQFYHAGSHYSQFRPPLPPLPPPPPPPGVENFDLNFNRPILPHHLVPSLQQYPIPSEYAQFPRPRTAPNAFHEHPLAPPSAPSEFPWTTTATTSIVTTQIKNKEEELQVSFVPVTVNSEELTAMSQSIQKQTEDHTPNAIKYLESNGLINASLPMELKEKFQPLYCKLCTLTLSSNIVAKDHYLGKRHNKAVQQWLIDNRIKLKRSVCPSGTTAVHIGDHGVPTISGTIKKVGQGQTPTTASGNHRFPAKRTASWNSAPPKRPKKTSEGGPNFDFCVICQLELTSKPHADQHYSGKHHKAKALKVGRQHGTTDPNIETMFGFGAAFRRKQPNPPDPNGFKSFSNLPLNGT